MTSGSKVYTTECGHFTEKELILQTVIVAFLYYLPFILSTALMMRFASGADSVAILIFYVIVHFGVVVVFEYGDRTDKFVPLLLPFAAIGVVSLALVCLAMTTKKKRAAVEAVDYQQGSEEEVEDAFDGGGAVPQRTPPSPDREACALWEASVPPQIIVTNPRLVTSTPNLDTSESSAELDLDGGDAVAERRPAWEGTVENPAHECFDAELATSTTNFVPPSSKWDEKPRRNSVRHGHDLAREPTNIHLPENDDVRTGFLRVLPILLTNAALFCLFAILYVLFTWLGRRVYLTGLPFIVQSFEILTVQGMNVVTHKAGWSMVPCGMVAKVIVVVFEGFRVSGLLIAAADDVDLFTYNIIINAVIEIVSRSGVNAIILQKCFLRRDHFRVSAFKAAYLNCMMSTEYVPLLVVLFATWFDFFPAHNLLKCDGTPVDTLTPPSWVLLVLFSSEVASDILSVLARWLVLYFRPDLFVSFEEGFPGVFTEVCLTLGLFQIAGNTMRLLVL